MKRSKPRIRRGTISRYIEAADVLAVLQVPVVYSAESPGEPLLEAKTLKFLDEATRRAKAGDKAWLKKHGAKLYVSSPAA